MSNKLTVTFCSGVGTVTGANFLLETEKSKILIDCGMIQGEKFATEENSKLFSYDIPTIDALLVTHAHLDHVGRIPKLVKEGYLGPIYSTPKTKELAEIVLTDAVGILALEAKQNGTLPLYGIEDVEMVFMSWKTIPYHQEVKIVDDISVVLKDSGHILGSAMIEVTVRGPASRKILFTGDLGNSPAPLLRDTEEVDDVDFIIMESVYGDRNHEPKELRLRQFEKVIDDTLARGGTLVIPAFSIDRTQVLLYELNNLVDPKNTILLVGYQTAGSLGRQLANGAKKVSIHGRTIKVKAHIETIYGYSAHKDSDHLVEFVTTASDRLKQIFVVMGELKASMHLAQRLNDELMVKAIVPERERGYELE